MGIALFGVLDGPIFGLYTVGMMIPWVKTRGAMIGTLSSIGIMAWLVITTRFYHSQGKIPENSLPVSIDGCAYPWNETVVPTKEPLLPEDIAPQVYHISFLYYTMIGVFCTVVISTITSFILGETDISTVDPDHITPCMQR